jgi:diadenosine tetraphosphate (Ap4A) HIT family hydrolase
VPDTPAPLPDFTRWPSFPFEGDIRVKALDNPVDVEPPRKGEDPAECTACAAPDDAYIWVSDRWRVRSMDRPTGLPMVLILESRSHLDLGDLPNMLAAELGVMTVRLERAIRSLDDVARVHVNRSGDGEAHLHLWFMGRPQGRLQLRGTFLSLWDEILPPVPEGKWRENLALVAAWLAEFGGTPLAAPPRIDWKAPAVLETQLTLSAPDERNAAVKRDSAEEPDPVDERDAVDDEPGAADSAGDRVPVTPAVPAQPSAPATESSEAEAPAEPPADRGLFRRPVPGGASRP